MVVGVKEFHDYVGAWLVALGGATSSKASEYSEPEGQPTVMLPPDDIATPQPVLTEKSVEPPGPHHSKRSQKTPQHLRDFVLVLADC